MSGRRRRCSAGFAGGGDGGFRRETKTWGRAAASRRTCARYCSAVVGGPSCAWGKASRGGSGRACGAMGQRDAEENGFNRVALGVERG